MQRAYGILIAGGCMLTAGRFLAQWIINSIPTVNPAHSTMLTDAQYQCYPGATNCQPLANLE